jgi:catechol 2,3-dioxygenase-like lactoylglutathione lyase family enzyme
MTISLNHTIVTAADNDEAARFFAGVMGLEYTGAHPQGHHLAFDVDAVTFDTVVDRLDAREIPYGDEPAHADNGRVDEAHPLGGRGLYFSDSSGNLYELIAPPRI